MEKIYLRSTYSSRLDELHLRSCLIVSRFEDVEMRGLTIDKCEWIILFLCIFEVVFLRLEIILFAVFRACHDPVENIREDDEIVRIGSLRLRRDICYYECPESWGSESLSTSS
jgi:hypothetical protein